MTWTTLARPASRPAARGRVGPVVAPIVGAGLLLVGLTACDGSTKAGHSSTSASPGAGHASLSLDGQSYSFDVRCTNTGGIDRANGSSGAAAFTVALTGSPLSAVLVLTDTDGSRRINQAINDLRNDQGQAVGRVAITASGSTFTGSGTFVHTSVDAAGKRLDSTAAASPGTFTVTCPAGFS